MKKSNRIIQLDYIRAIACLLVVLLHVCAYYVNFFDDVSRVDWIVANTIESLARACVPLFFMVSGFLFMLEKKPKIKNFSRLVASLLFYSAIALAMFLVAKKISPSSIMMTDFNFFTEPSFYHLWFLYPMLGIYIFSYLISVNKIDSKYALLSVFVVFVVLNPRTSNLIEFTLGLNVNNLFMIDGVFIYYLLYAVSGAIIGSMVIKKELKLNKYAAILSIIISTVCISFLTLKTYEDGSYNEISFYDFNSPLVFILSLSIFYFIFSVKSFLVERAVVSVIAENSLAIYGIHAFVLSIVKRFIDYKLHNAFLFIPLIFALVVSISLIFSLALKLIDKKRLFT
ncbi:TPA: acyltransferase family protein [Morganella morganii]|nr:acyltransferase family protein [Morganella morganii]